MTSTRGRRVVSFFKTSSSRVPLRWDAVPRAASLSLSAAPWCGVYPLALSGTELAERGDGETGRERGEDVTDDGEQQLAADDHFGRPARAERPAGRGLHVPPRGTAPGRGRPDPG